MQNFQIEWHQPSIRKAVHRKVSVNFQRRLPTYCPWNTWCQYHVQKEKQSTCFIQQPVCTSNCSFRFRWIEFFYLLFHFFFFFVFVSDVVNARKLRMFANVATSLHGGRIALPSPQSHSRPLPSAPQCGDLYDSCKSYIRELTLRAPVSSTSRATTMQQYSSGVYTEEINIRWRPTNNWDSFLPSMPPTLPSILPSFVRSVCLIGLSINQSKMAYRTQSQDWS